METAPCDFCKKREQLPFIQSRDYINRIEGIFHAVKCPGCGLIYTNPRPDKSEIHRFYPDSYSAYDPGTNFDKVSKFAQGIYLRFLKGFLGYPTDKRSISDLLLFPVYLLKRGMFYTNAVPRYKENGKLLEIGCSHGKFLREMQRLGWNVTGIEFGEQPALMGKKLYGLDIINTDIDAAQFPDASFDAIIMKMVLEHVYSPDLMFEKMSRWLKPGGQLIITVPDISGLEARLFGKYHYGLHLPNHLYHFTPVTIRNYFSRHGFEISRIYHIKDTRDFKKGTEFFLEENPSGVAPKILRSSAFRLIRKPLLLLLFLFFGSSRMTIYGTKRNSSNIFSTPAT